MTNTYKDTKNITNDIVIKFRSIDVEQSQANINEACILSNFIERETSIRLKPTSKGHKGNCPFCATSSSKSKSKNKFEIYSSSNSFYCHKCNIGGRGAVGFAMKHQSLKFIDALKYVASAVNIELTYEVEDIKKLPPLPLPEKKEPSYLETRLNAFPELSDQLAKLLYSSDYFDNIVFNYIGFDGKKQTYIKNDALEIFTRKRIKNPKPNKPKYISDKGSGSKIYFTPFYYIFINPETRLFNIDSFDIVYVVEGEFKALALCLAGIPAIGLGGIEGATLSLNKDGHTKAEFKKLKGEGLINKDAKFFTASTTFLPELIEFINEYNPTTLIQLHDSDNFDNYDHETNQPKTKRKKDFKRSTNRFNVEARKHGIKHVYAYTTSKTLKGIDDLLHGVNASERDQLISELKSSCGGKHIVKHSMQSQLSREKVRRCFEKSTKQTAFLDFDKYLSECFNDDRAETINRFLKEAGNFYFHAPTGSGKSYACNKHLVPSLNELFPTCIKIMIAPLGILTKEFANSFEGFTAIVGGEGYESAKSVDLYKGQYLCTYKQASELLRRLKEKNGNLDNVILIVDELQEIVNSAYQNIAHLNEYFKEVKKLIGFTATPLEAVFTEVYGFKKIECTRAINPRLNITVNFCTSNPIAQVIKKSKEKYQANSKYQAIIFVDSVRLINATVEALNATGAKAVAVHNKLPKSILNGCPVINSIIQSNEIPEDTNFIITTRKLALGISILTKGIDIFYLAKDGRDFINFQQSIARPREYESIDIYVFFKEQQEEPTQVKFSKKRFEKEKDYLTEICAAQTKLYKLSCAKVELKRTPDNINNALLKCIAFDKDRGYFVDEPKLLYRQQQQIIRSTSNSKFIELMKELPNANVLIEGESTTIDTAAEAANFEEIKEGQAEATAAAAETIRELFTNNFDSLIFCAYKETQSDTLKHTLKNAATRINDKTFESSKAVRDEFLDFYTKYTPLVINHLPEVETYLNRYFKFKLDFNNTIEESEIIRMIFKSRYHYGHHYKQLAKLTLLESLNNEVEANHQNYLNFEIAQFDQAIINAVDKAIEGAEDNRLLKDDVLTLVKDINVRGLKEHLTSANIKKYLSCFYDVDVKRKRCGNGEFESYFIFEGKHVLNEIVTFKTQKVIKHQSSIIRKQKLMFDHPKGLYHYIAQQNKKEAQLC